MALAIASGFLLQSTAPNFERDMFSTIAEMKSYPEASLPSMFVCTNVEDGNVYVFNKTNEELETTGKWRKVGSGDSNIWIGTTAEYEAADALGTIPVGTLVFITDDTADGADTGIIYDTELSATSENAVTNKAIKEALDKKVDAVDGKGLSTYDFDDTAYNKLDGIQAGANKTVCDTTIQTSNNPVTNTAIKTALDKLMYLSAGDVWDSGDTGYIAGAAINSAGTHVTFSISFDKEIKATDISASCSTFLIRQTNHVQTVLTEPSITYHKIGLHTIQFLVPVSGYTLETPCTIVADNFKINFL